MATLIRRDIYDTVPGYEVRGTNPGVATFGVSQFGVTSPLSNYSQFEQQYAADTNRWGMLASHYGPATRFASQFDISTLYSGGFTHFGGSGNVGVNVLIDRDLSAKQATPDTIHYFRKVSADLTPTSVAGFTAGLSALRHLSDNTRNIINSNITDIHRAYSQGVNLLSPPPSGGQTITIPGVNIMNFYGQPQSKSSVPTVTARPVAGLLTPNINTFGGWGAQTYRPNERLLPVGSGGAFMSPVYSIR